jgi:hypothetical protein
MTSGWTRGTGDLSAVSCGWPTVARWAHTWMAHWTGLVSS